MRRRVGNAARRSLAAWILLLLQLLFLTTVPALGAREPVPLSILQPRYPRAFFFRHSEQACSERLYPTYESWAAQFERLQGIMGKCLDEECLGREPRNIEFFTRFKREHPDQVVLLHFNGNARDPRYHTQRYFPGHWIYRRAVEITQDVPAREGESVIHVADCSDFRVNAGRYQTSNDDIALCGIKPDGTHDWDHCEQVQLISVDRDSNTIRVRRACYGTRPLRFQAHQARAAAHQVEGPWGQTNNIMWFYNFSTGCPRDRDGRSCADLLVDDLAAWFGPGGKLAAFDGLEFDVMFNQTHGDTDGDGQEDNGVIDGVNQYGIGVVQFAQQLRARMGDDFVIQGDGALGPGGRVSQRAWGILNGIESEGWPNLGDWEMDDWSGGMNRHFYWRDYGHAPVFSYVNHKWEQAVPDQPGIRAHPEVPFARHRLVFAACQVFDAATCYSFVPPRDADGMFGVWDELRCGVEDRVGWLGRPEGPAVRLATRTPDLLHEQGLGDSLANRISGPVQVSRAGDEVQVATLEPAAADLRFTIKGVPASGPDLYVEVVMRGKTRSGYPRQMARFAEVGASGGMIDLMSGAPPTTGMKLRRSSLEVALDSATGAVFQRRPANLGGETLPAYFVHPPYRNGMGYVFWERELEIPPQSVLEFSVGMGEKSPLRSDGVRFEVQAAVVSDGSVGSYDELMSITTKEHRWLPRTVSLAQYGGKRVRLKFVADCGPQDDPTTDHAHWGAVKILSEGGQAGKVTELKQYMTWLGDEAFRSGFYYSHIQTDEVDLTFDIEGNEPVMIRSVSVHAHPDTIFRLFENGLVLANPSRSPYEFDVARLSPGRAYRRLLGTANQDTQTNNGEPVGERVTLGPRDGLFLLRVDR